MSQPFPEIDARLEELRAAAGLAEAEVRIARALADAFRTGLDRLAELPPSRRRWADFWAGKPDAFAEGVSRTGSELVGLSAGPEEEKWLAPNSRLLTAEVARLFRAGDTVASSRFTLAAKTARFLFAYVAV